MCLTLPHAGSECELNLTTSRPTVKPDPPSNVTAWQMEGQETRMKVTWNLPTSWRHLSYFYKLSFELKYRPLMSSFHYEQVSNWGHEWMEDGGGRVIDFHISVFFTAFPLLFGTFCPRKRSDKRITVFILTVSVAYVYGCSCWGWRISFLTPSLMCCPALTIWFNSEHGMNMMVCGVTGVQPYVLAAGQVNAGTHMHTANHQRATVVGCMISQRLEVKNSLDFCS